MRSSVGLVRVIEERFLARDRSCIDEGLHGSLSEAIAALMGSYLIVFVHPDIEVGLQLADCRIDLFAEGYAIELIEHGLVKALDDAVGLRALCLGTCVIDVLHREVEFVFAAVMGAAIFGPSKKNRSVEHRPSFPWAW